MRPPLRGGSNWEFGRGDTTRTCDLMVPNHPLYQAELRPDVIRHCEVSHP